MDKNNLSKEDEKFIDDFIANNDFKTAEDVSDALTRLFGATIEKMMKAELTHHLGYEKNEYTDSENSRNGYSTKKVHSTHGDLQLKVPRDRDGSFEPIVVPKGQKDISSIEQKIINLYARGISNAEIHDMMSDLYGINVSPDMISDITDKIIPEIREWQNRQLDPIYSIVFLDATYFNVKEEGHVVKKAAYIALGVNMEGQKDILGIYLSESESAKYWLNILNQLKNRGVKDILILCADGLSGLKEAISAAFPQTEFQRCIVHMIRNTMQYVSYKDRKELASDLKMIYRANNAEEAYDNLQKLKKKWAPRKISLENWENNWDAVVPFFKYGEETRKIIYTTNAIESLNNMYKKMNKGRRVFTTEQALEKCLYLSTKIIMNKWTTRYRNWGVTLSELKIYFKDRIDIYN